MSFATILDTLTTIIWSPALVFVCLAVGIFFTISTLFMQIRCIPDMFQQMVGNDDSESGVSSFKALMISLAGRVGVGNIAGVATAIAYGGPGAVFWMWIVAIFGAATSFMECTLAQIYKEKDQDTGEYRGGPAYYIEKTFQHTRARKFMLVYAIIFAVCMVLSGGYFLLGIQANGVADAMRNAWGINVWLSAAVSAVLVGIIIMGGVKRIANFASLVVPFMAIIYILAAVIIMFVNFDRIDDVFSLIFRSAFDREAMFSGMLGAAIMWGVKRGIYSNEAGQGTGPQSAAAAEVSHPAKQGFVQAFAVYAGTLFVCSATAFIILSTDMYKVFEGESQDGPVRYAGQMWDPASSRRASIASCLVLAPGLWRWPLCCSHSPRCWPTTTWRKPTWPISTGGFPTIRCGCRCSSACGCWRSPRWLLAPPPPRAMRGPWATSGWA